ncbi:MAG: STAS domain-containing protein [Desulfobacteraceae bacterium]|nr:STAS domain-containing protein [Desulfobacteraceae bacterium]
MKNVFPETTVILGIPIDNLDLEQVIARIFKMASDYETDGRPRTAVAVDIDTLIRFYSGNRSREESGGGLVNTLRQSDLMIPIGRPVGWTARLVGTRLKQKFSCTDFFRRFLSAVEAGKKSLFLLGSDSGGIYRAADILGEARPGLKMAGSAHPPDRQEESRYSDAWLLEKINAAAADFLVLDLRDPATGLWFEKYRHRMYVPVTLVTTGVHRFIRAAGRPVAGTKPRGRPAHKRFAGVSLFLPRIWERFFYTSIMFSFTIFPLVMYQQYQQISYKLFRIRSPIPSIKSRISKSGRGVALRIVSMPDPLDASMAGEIKEELKHMVELVPKTVLDFSGVNFMDSSGLGLLLSLWRTAAAKNREIFIIGIRPPVFRFFSLSRTLDFFEKSMCETIDDVIGVLSRRSDSSSLYYLAAIRGNAAVFHMYGELDASRVIDIDMNSVLETIGRRNAVMNLSGLNFVDSAGMHFFVKIQRHVARRGKCCILYGLRDNVRQMFKILRIDRLFVIADDLEEAENKLEDRLFDT